MIFPVHEWIGMNKICALPEYLYPFRDGFLRREPRRLTHGRLSFSRRCCQDKLGAYSGMRNRNIGEADVFLQPWRVYTAGNVPDFQLTIADLPEFRIRLL